VKALPPETLTTAGVDAGTFRHALGHFLTGVTIVTTTDRGSEPVGMTANAFTAVSLDPPLVAVCLARSAASHRAMAAAARFAVHVLSSEQEDVSLAFARTAADGARKFDGVAWTAAPDGLPLLDDHLVRLECRAIERVEAGDHVIHLGRVEAAAIADGDAAPLAFFRGRHAHVLQLAGRAA
jgi:flavin reductase (DIM6/NTAB) family NADH-FMN oxidoreductase RutF